MRRSLSDIQGGYNGTRRQVQRVKIFIMILNIASQGGRAYITFSNSLIQSRFKEPPGISAVNVTIIQSRIWKQIAGIHPSRQALTHAEPGTCIVLLDICERFWIGRWALSVFIFWTWIKSQHVSFSKAATKCYGNNRKPSGISAAMPELLLASRAGEPRCTCFMEPSIH